MRSVKIYRIYNFKHCRSRLKRITFFFPNGIKKIDCLYVLVKFDFYKDISFWEKGRIELKFIIVG